MLTNLTTVYAMNIHNLETKTYNPTKISHDKFLILVAVNLQNQPTKK